MSKDEQLRKASRLVGRLMIARKDVKAVEGPEHWVPVKSPFSLDDFERHFFGDRCLGTYLLDTDSNVRCLAFDVDLKNDTDYWVIRDLDETERMEAAGEYEGELDPDTRSGDIEAALHDTDHEGCRWARTHLRAVAGDLARKVEDMLGIPPLVVVTGGGAHVIVPFGELLPASDARAMGRQVMESFGGFGQKSENFWVPDAWVDVPTDKSRHSVEIEVFPKQDVLASPERFGNLIRLPLGKHRETGRRSFFMDWRNRSVPAFELHKIDAIEAMQQVADTLGVDA